MPVQPSVARHELPQDIAEGLIHVHPRIVLSDVEICPVSSCSGFLGFSILPVLFVLRGQSQLTPTRLARASVRAYLFGDTRNIGFLGNSIGRYRKER